MYHRYERAIFTQLRNERALMLTLAEMYIHGVTTRRVIAIPERFCGTSVSATQVSKAIAMPNQTLEAWRQRPLSECPYILLDARYEKVRQDGQVSDAAILMACGVD